MADAKAIAQAIDPVHVYINCPFCNKVHMHGSSGDIDKKNYGTRISHCQNKDVIREYEIVVDNATIRNLKEYNKQQIEKIFGNIV